MSNYCNNKRRYKPNNLGSLYVEKSNEQSVFFIGSQTKHNRCHKLEQTGLTANPGHKMFTGTWSYDYPVVSKTKELFCAENFLHNLITSLKENNLHDVILISESHDGLIASYVTQSELVSKVIAIYPPILGTPLVNQTYIQTYKKALTKYQHLVLSALKVFINPKYSFEQDNFKGLDLNKLLVIGNYLDIDKEQNALLNETYNMIKMITGFTNDGVVIFEPNQFESLGKEEQHNNHLAASSKENITKVYNKIIN